MSSDIIVIGLTNNPTFHKAIAASIGLALLAPHRYNFKGYEFTQESDFPVWATLNPQLSKGLTIESIRQSPAVFIPIVDKEPIVGNLATLIEFIKKEFGNSESLGRKTEFSVLAYQGLGYAQCNCIFTMLTEAFPETFGVVTELLDQKSFNERLEKVKFELLENVYGDEEKEKISKHTASPLIYIASGYEHVGDIEDLKTVIRERLNIIVPKEMKKKPVNMTTTFANAMLTSKPSRHYESKRSNEDPVVDGDGKGYDYDLIVIGGGSGGLACAKQAAKYGKKVCCCDFVTPTPLKTTWGLGGTCVNVGCIPKKLMHQASIHGEAMHDAKFFGWNIPHNITHTWEVMVKNVQHHIHALNKGYEEQLKSKLVTYENALATFIDKHTLQLTNQKGEKKNITGRRFVIAVGGRPAYPNIPGSLDCITSDDIFSMPSLPGKNILVIGASYVALECAGFLTGIGYKVTVMVRSILLRGFDQDMASRIGKFMEQSGTRFIRDHIPIKVEKEEKQGQKPLFKVTYVPSDQEHSKDPSKRVETFDLVMFAIGRNPLTKKLGLEKVGVKVDEKTGKIPVECEQTNISHVYALGDVAICNQPGAVPTALELTPVAIKAGKLLADRLYGGSKMQMDYQNVPTTIFTPIEYGCIGYTEQQAIQTHGEENIEVYHSSFQPLETTLPNRLDDTCYTKLICHQKDDGRVIGFHFLGPNAGEITQGFAVAMKCGARKEDFDVTVGIHPTAAEQLTTLDVSKKSGETSSKSGC